MVNRRGLFGWVAAALAMPVAFAAKARPLLSRAEEEAVHLEGMSQKVVSDLFYSDGPQPPWPAPYGSRYVGSYMGMPIYEADSLPPSTHVIRYRLADGPSSYSGFASNFGRTD